MNYERIGNINGFDIFMKSCDYATMFWCYWDFSTAVSTNGIKLEFVLCPSPHFIATVI